MRTLKWILFGIAVILFGLCAILLSGLPDVPTFHNGILELLGVICPVTGVAFAAYGFARKES